MDTATKIKLQAAELSKKYFAPATTVYHSWDNCPIPPAASFITKRISSFTTTGSGQFHSGPTFSTCYAGANHDGATSCTTMACPSFLSLQTDES